MITKMDKMTLVAFTKLYFDSTLLHKILHYMYCEDKYYLRFIVDETNLQLSNCLIGFLASLSVIVRVVDRCQIKALV